MYTVLLETDPDDASLPLYQEQTIKVNSEDRRVRRVERGSSTDYILWMTDSRGLAGFAMCNVVDGSFVFLSAWSGATIPDILAQTDIMLRMGCGKRGLVLTVGVNDVIAAHREGKFFDKDKVIIEVDKLLQPLRFFLLLNRHRFLHLFATDVYSINHNIASHKVSPENVPMVNRAINFFNIRLHQLLDEYGGRIILTHPFYESGDKDGLHIAYQHPSFPSVVPRLVQRFDFSITVRKCLEKELCRKRFWKREYDLLQTDRRAYKRLFPSIIAHNYAFIIKR